MPAARIKFGLIRRTQRADACKNASIASLRSSGAVASRFAGSRQTRLTRHRLYTAIPDKRAGEPTTTSMCYYPTIIKNPRYKPNKKNKGKPPVCPDERMLYIKIPCGVCKECIRRKQSEWVGRIQNEIKFPHRKDEKPVFLTFTFDDEHIAKLGAENAEKATSEHFAEAIKAWQKRYYKLTKRTVRHWIVNEWGPDNSHRLHGHGIVWTHLDEEELKNTWIYGFLDIGRKGVNAASAAYAVKYIGKQWSQGDEYKSKIFASKGIGKNYIEKEGQKFNQYNGEQTRKYSRDLKGFKRSLPQYVRQKLWTEEQRLEMFGAALDLNEIWLDGERYKLDSKEDIKRYVEARDYLRRRALLMGFQKPIRKKNRNCMDSFKNIAIFAT